MIAYLSSDFIIDIQVAQTAHQKIVAESLDIMSSLNPRTRLLL
jgi:hypothetical protein